MSKNMIWITGADGHVGTALHKVLPEHGYHVLCTNKEDVDVTDMDAVRLYAEMNRPTVIINCAALTNPSECEANTEEAYKVNAIGARNLATAAERLGAKLVQMSTDDVFDGDSEVPYNEFDNPVPRSIYGKSKLAGEQMVSSLCTRHIIIRSSWVYGTGADFVHEFLEADGRIEVASDECAVPTSAKELAKTIKEFIDHDHYGTYHAVCQGGGCSRFEYAREVLKMAGKEDRLELHPIVADEEHKSQYSVLDNMMLRITGLEEPKNWKEALKEYMEESGGRMDGRN